MIANSWKLMKTKTTLIKWFALHYCKINLYSLTKNINIGMCWVGNMLLYFKSIDFEIIYIIVYPELSPTDIATKRSSLIALVPFKPGSFNKNVYSSKMSLRWLIS